MNEICNLDITFPDYRNYYFDYLCSFFGIKTFFVSIYVLNPSTNQKMFVVELEKIYDTNLSPLLNAFQMLEQCQS